jgi:predicted ribosomally synthesized peptide with nif11-like leader
MAQVPVTQFFAAVKQDEALKAKCQATTDAKTCVQLAEDWGYRFTPEELQAELSKLPEEALAELVNPGIAPRRHLNPR